MTKQPLWKLLSAMIVGIFVLAACQPASPPADEGTPDGDASKFISLEEHIGIVQVAEFDKYVELENAQVEDSEAFDAMKRHILVMYEDVESPHSFVSDDQYFDCIRIEDQPSVRLLGISPEDIDRVGPDLAEIGEFTGSDPDAGEDKFVPSPLTPGEVDQSGNASACEEGMIPMRRLTLEDMVRFPNLERFFGRTSDGSDQSPPISQDEGLCCK
jgi:hypothetical protein